MGEAMTKEQHAQAEELAITLAGDDLGLTADEVREEWEAGEFSTADMRRWREAARGYVIAFDLLRNWSNS
jgi:hypothetical protein